MPAWVVIGSQVGSKWGICWGHNMVAGWQWGTCGVFQVVIITFIIAIVAGNIAIVIITRLIWSLLPLWYVLSRAPIGCCVSVSARGGHHSLSHHHHRHHRHHHHNNHCHHHHHHHQSQTRACYGVIANISYSFWKSISAQKTQIVRKIIFRKNHRG